jgi:hypothetical protein
MSNIMEIDGGKYLSPYGWPLLLFPTMSKQSLECSKILLKYTHKGKTMFLKPFKALIINENITIKTCK